MKKMLVLILAAIICACGLASCKGDQSDLEYVKEKGVLTVGITRFAPMDYEESEGSGNWIGFDADMAKAFAESLGVKVEFVVINWDSKVMELNNKSIDCVWNGMTLTDGVKEAMETSKPYCTNEQVKGLSFAAEAGSAGEEVLTALGFKVTSVQSQADAVMEVAAGTSDAAVIDLLMAGAVIGKGTSYENLVYTVSLSAVKEEYGVGFRKGSELAEKLNGFFDKARADGSMEATAAKYGVNEALIKSN